MLQASDGAIIYINNTGYLYPTDNKPLDRSDPSWGGDREFYFRLTPVFDTPVGPHDWLTRTVIVGTGKRHANPDYTIFTYYAVLWLRLRSCRRPSVHRRGNAVRGLWTALSHGRHGRNVHRRAH